MAIRPFFLFFFSLSHSLFSSFFSLFFFSGLVTLIKNGPLTHLLASAKFPLLLGLCALRFAQEATITTCVLHPRTQSCHKLRTRVYICYRFTAQECITLVTSLHKSIMYNHILEKGKKRKKKFWLV